MPILQTPARISPGQFGPTNRVCPCLRSSVLTWTMSSSGIPSVIATAKGIFDSIAFKIEHYLYTVRFILYAAIHAAYNTPDNKTVLVLSTSVIESAAANGGT